MKKNIALFISLSILILNTVVAYSQENKKIQGLDELIDVMCLDSDENADLRVKIQEEYTKYSEEMIPKIMKNPDIAKTKMGIDIGDDDYETAQIRDMYTLDFSTGILVSSIETAKYSAQYAQNNCFSYLFYNEGEKFCVDSKRLGGGSFSKTGEHLKKAGMILLNDTAMNYIKNHEQLNTDLIK